MGSPMSPYSPRKSEPPAGSRTCMQATGLLSMLSKNVSPTTTSVRIPHKPPAIVGYNRTWPAALPSLRGEGRGTPPLIPHALQ